MLATLMPHLQAADPIPTPLAETLPEALAPSAAAADAAPPALYVPDPLEADGLLVSTTAFPHEILLFPERPGEPSILQIRNAAPRGVRSKILVEQVKTVRLAAPADE
jgi:hypothetical protein